MYQVINNIGAIDTFSTHLSPTHRSWPYLVALFLGLLSDFLVSLYVHVRLHIRQQQSSEWCPSTWSHDAQGIL